MLHPSYTDLMAVVNSDVEPGEQPVVQSRYSIVLATAKRARQLISGHDPLVRTKGKEIKPLSIAVEELYNSKIKILNEDDIDEEEFEITVSEEADNLPEEEVSEEAEETAEGELPEEETTNLSEQEIEVSEEIEEISEDVLSEEEIEETSENQLSEEKTEEISKDKLSEEAVSKEDIEHTEE